MPTHAPLLLYLTTHAAKRAVRPSARRGAGPRRSARRARGERGADGASRVSLTRPAPRRAPFSRRAPRGRPRRCPPPPFFLRASLPPQSLKYGLLLALDRSSESYPSSPCSPPARTPGPPPPAAPGPPFATYVLEHRTMARPTAPIQSSLAFSSSAYRRYVVSGVLISKLCFLCALRSADLTVVQRLRSIMPWGAS